MKDILFRSTQFDMSNDGRNLEGLVFQWDKPSMVSDDGGRRRYLEAFDRRSTEKTLKMRSLRPLFVKHQHLKGSVGETDFQPGDEGLLFRSRFTDSVYAGETLEKVNSGEYDSVSVGFRAIKTLLVRSVKVRSEIAIEELSLTPLAEAQHDGARILAVRSLPLDDRVARRRRLVLAEISAKLAELK